MQKLQEETKVYRARKQQSSFKYAATFGQECNYMDS